MSRLNTICTNNENDQKQLVSSKNQPEVGKDVLEGIVVSKNEKPRAGKMKEWKVLKRGTVKIIRNSTSFWVSLLCYEVIGLTECRCSWIQ